MIQINHIHYSDGDTVILDEITTVLHEQKIAIIGANGSGKSTFARMLNGLLLPSRGTVLVDGLDTQKQGKAIRKKVGFVFQNPDNQIVFPIVEEDIDFGLKNLKIPKEKRKQKIHDILSHYGLLPLKKSLTHKLSGGQKQLLALASVLVMQPDYIILDEPTTLLDLKNKMMMFDVIHHLSQHVILATHDLELIKDFDRALVFDQGRIVMDDRPKAAIAYYRKLMMT